MGQVRKDRPYTIYAKDYCEQCLNRDIRLDVHHIDKNRLNNDPNNLMTLCLVCHAKLHGEDIGPETRLRMSRANKGENNGFHGKKHDLQAKIKMRNKRGKWWTSSNGNYYVANHPKSPKDYLGRLNTGYWWTTPTGQEYKAMQKRNSQDIQGRKSMVGNEFHKGKMKIDNV